MKTPERADGIKLLLAHNKDAYLIRHALTMEAVMRSFAQTLDHGDEADTWGIVGLLHDIDFGEYPTEHCAHAPAMLSSIGADDDFIRAVISHGYGICSEVKPESLMEKVHFAADELTGLIYAAALMRPSKSAKDMELKSLRKKFKDKSFAAGCSRDVVRQGAEMLGWELDDLLTKTLEAMRAMEDTIEDEIAQTS